MDINGLPAVKPADYNNPNAIPWDKTNANAELLFLIVEGSDLNGSSATELFGKSEVGDTDNDGADAGDWRNADGAYFSC